MRTGFLLSGWLVLAGCRPEATQPIRPTAGSTADLGQSTVSPIFEDATSAGFEWKHSYEYDHGAGMYAVVKPGATLRAEPSRQSRAWVYDGLHVQAVKVFDRGSEFVAIQLDWPDRPTEHHCVGSQLANFGLRMFVLESDLLEVTTRAATIELDEGVGMNVATGVLVNRASAGAIELVASTRPISPSYVGGADYFILELDSAALEVGKFYVPTLTSSLPEPLSLEATGELHYGNKVLRFATWFDRVYAGTESAQLMVGTACMQVAGHYSPLPTGEVWHRNPGGRGCSLPPPTSPEAWEVRAGTKLTWPDGSDAGMAFRDFAVSGPLVERVGVSCFELLLGCGRSGPIRVCADASGINPAPPLEF